MATEKATVTPAAGSPEATAVNSAAVDKAWADEKTDLGMGESAGAGIPPIEREEEDVIVVPPGAKKPSVTGEAPEVPGKEAPPAVEEPGKEKPVAAAETPPAAEVKTDDQKLSDYWNKITGTPGFANAAQVCRTPKFQAWFQSLTPTEQSAANDLDHPDQAVAAMGRYYQDLADGKVQEPPPPAPPPAIKALEYLKESGLDQVKILDDSGKEVSLADLAKTDAEGYGGELFGAMSAFSQHSINQANLNAQQLIRTLIENGTLVTRQEFDRVRKRFDDGELFDQDPLALAESAKPEFDAFLKSSKLAARAWASGEVEDRVEAVNLFRKVQATAAVGAQTEAQRRAAAAKGSLHKGSLRGGQAVARKPGEGEETPEQQVERAWADPTPME